MTVAFRSKTIGGGAAATGVTLTEPAGATLNDILWWWQVVAATETGYAGPTGWTLASALTSTKANTWLYWIRRGASAPNLSASWTNSSYTEGSITCWSGCETSGNPYSDLQINARTSRNPCAPNCPAVNTGVANTIVVACGMGWAGWAAGTGGWGAPLNYTMREDCSAFTEGDICVASRAIAVAGSENPPAFGNAKGVSDEVAEITFALKPPAAVAAANLRMLMGVG